jgi:hypothetical protein
MDWIGRMERLDGLDLMDGCDGISPVDWTIVMDWTDGGMKGLAHSPVSLYVFLYF